MLTVALHRRKLDQSRRIRKHSRLFASFVAVLLLMAIASVSFIDFISASNVQQPLNSFEFDSACRVDCRCYRGDSAAMCPSGRAAIAPLCCYSGPSRVRQRWDSCWLTTHADALDAYSYHELAVGSSVQFGELVWGHSTRTRYLDSPVPLVLTPAYYHLAKVVFSFVGLVGIYLTWRALAVMTGEEKLQHLYLLGLFP